jgi:hypothetical protein
MAFPSKQTVQSVARRGQQAAAQLRREKKEIVLTAKNREAIEAMVFDGLKRPDAAALVGLTDHALRTALTKPHVLAFLNECMEVLRTGLRPRALHTMGELLESKNDSTKFKAAEYLHGENRGIHTVGGSTVINNNTLISNTVNVTPGYVIRIGAAKGNGAPQIEHLEAHGPKGLPDLADVPEDE